LLFLDIFLVLLSFITSNISLNNNGGIIDLFLALFNP